MAEIPNSYEACRSTLRKRLRELAPGRIQLVTGPRQAGKTTLLLEIAEHFGDQAIYAAGDDPDAALPGFWDRQWSEAQDRAKQGPVILLMDEVHHLSDWAGKLKGYWDRASRQRLPIHVVATGSSALRVDSGSRESLAGRFERLTLGHWPAASLVPRFCDSSSVAASLVVNPGAYPGAMSLLADPKRWRSYVRDAIIEPAIGRDVLAMGTVRRPALLRQIFAIAVASPAQIVSLQKLQGQLQDAGALETIAHYLDLLRDGYLVVGLEKYSAQIVRRRSSPPKLVVLNNALIAAMSSDDPPDAQRDSRRFGCWVENACLAFAWNQSQQVMYWREEPLEVDGVLDGSWGKWAVEIKTEKFDSQDLRGLLEFCRRHPTFTPLVITAPGNEDAAKRHGIRAVSWKRFLLSGPHD